jgi:riboflavin biosynthesis pyrimidine reductase
VDDPQMNVRQLTGDVKKPIIVLDRLLRLSGRARIFTSCHPIIILHASHASEEKIELLKAAGAELCPVPCDAQGLLNLHDVLKFAGQHGYHHLWVEAGWRCSQSFLAQGLVNEFWLYIAKHREDVRTKPTSWVYELGQARSFDMKLYGEDVVFHLQNET